jgi:hypothetical protein
MCPIGSWNAFWWAKGVLVFRFRLMAAVGAATVLLVSLVPSAANAAVASAGSTGVSVMAAPYVTVQLQSENGSGCPAGSTTVTPSSSGQGFIVLYSKFMVKGDDIFKNCTAIIKVGVPGGWTYAVYSILNRGFAFLNSGATGKLQATAFFSGVPGQLKMDKTLTGPYDDAWEVDLVNPALTWAPCNSSTSVNINDTIRVDGPSSSAMALYSKDASASTIFNLRFKTC